MSLNKGFGLISTANLLQPSKGIRVRKGEKEKTRREKRVQRASRTEIKGKELEEHPKRERVLVAIKEVI